MIDVCPVSRSKPFTLLWSPSSWLRSKAKVSARGQKIAETGRVFGARIQRLAHGGVDVIAFDPLRLAVDRGWKNSPS